jgi:6-pyruvoyl-tetrahydropterin synthase
MPENFFPSSTSVPKALSPEAPTFVPSSTMPANFFPSPTGVPKAHSPVTPKFVPAVPESAASADQNRVKKSGVLSWSEACALGSKAAKRKIAAAPPNSLIIKHGHSKHSSFGVADKSKGPRDTTQKNVNKLFADSKSNVLPDDTLEDDLRRLRELDFDEEQKEMCVKMFTERLKHDQRVKFVENKAKALERLKAKAAEQGPPDTTQENVNKFFADSKSNVLPNERRDDIEMTAAENADLGNELVCRVDDLGMHCSRAAPEPARSKGRGYNHVGYEQPSGLISQAHVAAPLASSLDDPEDFGEMDEEHESEGFDGPPDDVEIEPPVFAGELADEPPQDPAQAVPPVRAGEPADEPPQDPAQAVPPVRAGEPADEPPQDPARAYVAESLTSKIYIMPRPVESVLRGTGNVQTVLGTVIASPDATKSRVWLVISKRDASCEEVFNTAVDVGLGAVACASFAGQWYALFQKKGGIRVRAPEGYVLFNPTKDGKTTDTGVCKTFEHFCKNAQAIKTNLAREEVDAEYGIMEPEQVLRHCRWMKLRQFSLLMMQAKRAGAKMINYRQEPEKAPLHRALNTFGADIKADMVEKERVGAGIVMHAEDPRTEQICSLYFDDAEDHARKLKLITWDDVEKVPISFTIEQWNDSDKYIKYSVFLVGPPRMGKSTMLHMLGKQHCVKSGLSIGRLPDVILKYIESLSNP